ncbi:MAG: hypothetical protein WD534_02685 [Phycisphaeraceae bacterium]
MRQYIHTVGPLSMWVPALFAAVILNLIAGPVVADEDEAISEDAGAGLAAVLEEPAEPVGYVMLLGFPRAEFGTADAMFEGLAYFHKHAPAGADFQLRSAWDPDKMAEGQPNSEQYVGLVTLEHLRGEDFDGERLSKIFGHQGIQLLDLSQHVRRTSRVMVPLNRERVHVGEGFEFDPRLLNLRGLPELLGAEHRSSLRLRGEDLQALDRLLARAEDNGGRLEATLTVTDEVRYSTHRPPGAGLVWMRVEVRNVELDFGDGVVFSDAASDREPITRDEDHVVRE